MLSACVLWGTLSHLGAYGARVRRQAEQHAEPEVTKFIQGVPVFNADMAHGGKSGIMSADELEAEEEDWMLLVEPHISDADIVQLCELSKTGCHTHGHPSAGGVPFLKVRGTESDLSDMLEGVTGVEAIEPDLPMHKLDEAEEESEGRVTAASWGLSRVGVSQSTQTGKGVNVYILDSGIRTTHNDFGGRALPAIDLSGGSLKTCSGGDSSCARDRDGHGTHCAGTAAGKSYGVAPGARLYAGKVLDDSGSGSWSWAVSALDWIPRKGRRPFVASMSLGSEGKVRSLERAMNSATSAGLTVVVAAGNENDNACGYTPAFVNSAIAVGSTTSRDARSSFSNFGPCVDIWAPGSSIISASVSSDSKSSSLSGTSMACPHVSGASALLLQANSGLSPSQVRQRLLSSAKSGKISGLKSGDTNKFLWVGGGGSSPSPTPSPSPSPSPTTRRRRRRS